LQRVRILTAITELAHERGAAALTVAQVVERSRVSRRTFYELFDDRDQCLLAAFDYAVRRARGAAQAACEAAGDDWLEQLRASVYALLVFLEEEPAMGGLCIVDALGADRRVLEHRARVLAELVQAVHRGQGSEGRSPHPGQYPERIVAEGAVGAVLSVLHARLSAPPSTSEQPLLALLNPLVSIIVLPYLGPAAAERELRRATPRARARSSPPTTDPLLGLQMRLTYRTVRVLTAIAEQPASSGRQIAQAAGINDQGQVSKLLWRLEHLGLIQNTATTARSKGAPNAWALTPKGSDIHHAIDTQNDS
jgi:AcrR family transcriptional regulator